MSPTLVALVAFGAWTVLLVFGLALLRGLHAQRTGKDITSFAPESSWCVRRSSSASS